MAGAGVEREAAAVSWYDNEWGCSCRVGDLIKLLLRKGIEVRLHGNFTNCVPVMGRRFCSTFPLDAGPRRGIVAL